MKRYTLFTALVALVFLAGGSGTTFAAAGRALAWRTIAFNEASGQHDGTGESARIAWSTEVVVEDGACARLVFSDVDLGSESYVLVRAANGDLRLNALAMKEYSFGSAILAGGRIAVELYVAPRDHAVRVRIDHVLVGTRTGPEIASICGPNDDRAAFNDNRVGRLTLTSAATPNPVCTAWRIANGAFLTAGHCADFDPDGSGSMLPDGTLDLMGFVEFNVPLSNADATIVLAHVDHQYPVDRPSVVWRYDGEGQGRGKDWAVFRVNPNANTRLLPHHAYGPSFRVTRELPTANETIRVTGFGTDAGTANQTNQTHLGPFLAENTSGADISIDHMVDTMPANSGSPLIWEEMSLTIGIHTNGGCNATGTASNSGTSFEVDALETAINDLPGAQTIYVDLFHPMRIAEEGTLFRPYQLLPPALAATPTGGVLSLYVGAYGIPSGTILNRAMTVDAPSGEVAIFGN